MNSISLFSWNIHGSLSKLDNLYIVSLFDIVIISEVKHGYAFSLPGFDSIRSTIVAGEEHRGGVAVFYKHYIAPYLHHVETSVDQVWFQLTFMPDTWIGACYIAPRDSPYSRPDSFSRIQEYCTKGRVVLIGDLNARIPDLSAFNCHEAIYTTNPDQGQNENGREILSICKDFQLVPINHRKSEDKLFDGGLTYRQGQTWTSQLDWAFSSTQLAKSFLSFQILSSGFPQSDHAPLAISLAPLKESAELLAQRAADLGIYHTPHTRPFKRPIQYCDVIANRFTLPDPESLALDMANPQSASAILADVVYNACLVATRESDIPGDDHETHPHHQHSDRWAKVIATHSEKELWRAIGWDGHLHNAKAECEGPSDEDFAAHFGSLLNPTNEEIVTPENGPYIPVLDDEISAMEVKREIDKLKAGKAPGLDGVPPGVLKLLSPAWICTLTVLFNSVFISGSYPEEWAKAKLFTIYKKGPKLNPRNYRGISIISFMAKLYDSILNARLCQWFKPDVEQAGAQKERGCCEQILVLRLLIDFARHSKQGLYITFIDFQQAYDKVNRQKLLDVLSENGCGRRMLVALAAGLKDSQSVLNRKIIRSSMGVRQGGGSSCFLFTMFVNPLIRLLKALPPDGFLQDLHSLLLMDDAVIFASSRERMQQKLDVLSEYCLDYGMSINETKTKFLAVNVGDSHVPFNIGELRVQKTESYIYLGSPIMIAPLAHQVKAHVNAKMGSKRKFTSFLARNDSAPFHIKKKVWDAALNSSILYSCETWLCGNVQSAERVYASTLKEMLAVRLQTPTDVCLLELGVPPLKPLIASRQIKFLRYLQASAHFENSPAQFALNLSRRSPMGRHISTLLSTTSRNVVADAMRALESNVQDNIGSTKRQTYLLMNPSLCANRVYSRDLQVREHLRKAFTRLRLSAHSLKIETGRWSRLPREERLCSCQAGSVQTESHVVCDCSLTQHIRNNYPELNYSSLQTFFDSNYAVSQCSVIFECLNVF